MGTKCRALLLSDPSELRMPLLDLPILNLISFIDVLTDYGPWVGLEPCPGRILGIIGRDPSVSKSNLFQSPIFLFFPLRI